MDANANFLHKYAKKVQKLVENINFDGWVRGKTWVASF